MTYCTVLRVQLTNGHINSSKYAIHSFIFSSCPDSLGQMINLSEAAASSLPSDVEYRIHQVIKVLKPQLASNTLSKMS